MKLLLIFLIPLSSFTFLGVELNWYSFVALLILIVIIALRISTKDEEKNKENKLLLQYVYLIFCVQMFPPIVSY